MKIKLNRRRLEKNPIYILVIYTLVVSIVKKGNAIKLNEICYITNAIHTLQIFISLLIIIWTHIIDLWNDKDNRLIL